MHSLKAASGGLRDKAMESGAFALWARQRSEKEGDEIFAISLISSQDSRRWESVFCVDESFYDGPPVFDEGLEELLTGDMGSFYNSGPIFVVEPLELVEEEDYVASDANLHKNPSKQGQVYDVKQQKSEGSVSSTNPTGFGTGVILLLASKGGNSRILMCGDKECEYKVSYAEGESSGYLARETFEFEPLDDEDNEEEDESFVLKNITFGCATNDGNMPANGVLGLNSERVSRDGAMGMRSGSTAPNHPSSSTTITTSTSRASRSEVKPPWDSTDVIGGILTRTYSVKFGTESYTLLCYVGVVRRDLVGFPVVEFKFNGGAVLELTAEKCSRTMGMTISASRQLHLSSTTLTSASWGTTCSSTSIWPMISREISCPS
ncbi:eukaryotic aspartyl protease family protein [Striga asiatica]|uniref:Eukaryotic aspartyl protease family protein n=1 Tax=Striga asiatica TaxID=4170 RepID=A0A5A7RJR2_STRAF|nr:eukaryotic aspartyl protease family protein [Striga asiatica]